MRKPTRSEFRGRVKVFLYLRAAVSLVGGIYLLTCRREVPYLVVGIGLVALGLFWLSVVVGVFPLDEKGPG